NKPAPASDPGLISNETVAAVDRAFNTLTHTVVGRNARTLEDLVREMLRPMLKSWLDDNLPGLVERIVRAEIERVSRGYPYSTCGGESESGIHSRRAGLWIQGSRLWRVPEWLNWLPLPQRVRKPQPKCKQARCRDHEYRYGGEAVENYSIDGDA